MRKIEVLDNPNYPVGTLYSCEVGGQVLYKLVNVPCLEDICTDAFPYPMVAGIARCANALQKSLREEGVWTGTGAAPAVKEYVRQAISELSKD